jgi:hypothetical protein
MLPQEPELTVTGTVHAANPLFDGDARMDRFEAKSTDAASPSFGRTVLAEGGASAAARGIFYAVHATLERPQRAFRSIRVSAGDPPIRISPITSNPCRL